MGFFRAKATSRFPADMLQWLDKFGRFELDPISSGISPSLIGSRVADLYQLSQRDRDGFFADLQALVARDPGGFATYGAARLAWEILGGDCLRVPSALPLIDAGIEFKRARGLTSIHFTGYENQRISERRDNIR